MSSKWFTPRGTGGVQANADRQQQVADQQMGISADQQERAKQAWNTYQTQRGQMQPIRAGMLSSLSRPAMAMPTAYTPSASALSALRSGPDPAAVGQQVRSAYGGIADANLNTLTARRQSNLTGEMARRGLSGSSGEFSNMVGLQNWRDAAASQNNANATLAGIQAESGARDQQRTGYLNAEQLMQQGAQDQRANYGLGQQDYWNQLNYLNQDQNTLLGISDPSMLAALLSQAGAGYGNAANGYGQVASANGSMLGGLLNAGLTGYGMYRYGGK